jgi:glycosyltransferase involved in cell wall biosynthesis
MKLGYEAKRIFHNKTGLGNYSRDLIRILSNNYPNEEYYLYNPKPESEKLFRLISNTIFEKLPSTPLYKTFYNIWRQKGIIHDLKKDNIDIFHGLSGEIPSGLDKNNIKSVVTIHDLIFMRYPQLYSYFDRKIHYYKFKKSAKKADIVIAISEQTKSDIISFLKIPSEKIKVIYQGCQEVFKIQYTNEEKKIVKTKFNLPDQFILNVGTLEERKNALNIVKAIKNIDTYLVLIGKETPYSDKIKNYIKENNIENKVFFLKGLTSEELAIVYQLASVFVYPSIFEGFGIPVIEALYSKTPVITNIKGVFPEAGGPDSIYVNVNNEIEIQNEIINLLNNPEKRNLISKKGLTFVQKFNDDIIAKQVYNIYTELKNERS